jgi:hypothetical protein
MDENNFMLIEMEPRFVVYGRMPRKLKKEFKKSLIYRFGPQSKKVKLKKAFHKPIKSVEVRYGQRFLECQLNESGIDDYVKTHFIPPGLTQ